MGNENKVSVAVLEVWTDLVFQKLPGAAKAAAKLVGSIAEAGAAFISIGTAKSEQISQSIRDETLAKTRMMEAIVDAAIKSSQTDPELGPRALMHFAKDIISHQNNREKVVACAIELMRDDPPNPDSVNISDDWLNVFSSHAELADSDALQATWAAILAGEIRKPGCVSLMTIKLMSVIDNSAAMTIQKCSRYVLSCPEGKVIPLSGDVNNSPVYDDLLFLNSLGFIDIGPHSLTENVFQYGKYTLQTRNKEKALLQCAALTLAGRQLSELTSHDLDLEGLRYIRRQIRSPGHVFVPLDIYDTRSGALLSADELVPLHLTALSIGEPPEAPALT